MQWHNILNTDFSYLFLMSFLIILIFQNRTIEKNVNRLFIFLIAVSISIFVLGYFSNYLHSIPGAMKWCSFVSHVKYGLKPTMLFHVLLISERAKPLRKKIMMAVPLSAFLLFLPFSLSMGLICYHIPPSNTFVAGPYIASAWLILILYMIMIIVSAVTSHSSQKECIYILLGEFFIALNILCERVFQSIPGMENTVIAMAILIYYLCFISHTEAEYRLKKEKELTEAKMQAMTAQIKPHFIYNSLACIAEICHEDAPRAEEAVISFSSYLRSCFRSLTDDGMISFADELNTIENYIRLEQLQSPGQLMFVQDIRERQFPVPVLSIETLVENAVKHGIRKKRGGGTVTLKTFRDERGIAILIKDNGVGFDTAKQFPNKQPSEKQDSDKQFSDKQLSDAQFPDKTHLGLRNARIRLMEQCGASMHVSSVRDQGTEILIIIPKEQYSK